MPRTKSNGSKDSTAAIGFEAKLWLAADIHHLAPHGMTGFVLANGSMPSNQSGKRNFESAFWMKTSSLSH